jgi:hypothetical protein
MSSPASGRLVPKITDMPPKRMVTIVKRPSVARTGVLTWARTAHSGRQATAQSTIRRM